MRQRAPIVLSITARFRAGNSQYVTAATDVYVNVGAIQLGNT
jgi:hypothetical protein